MCSMQPRLVCQCLLRDAAPLSDGSHPIPELLGKRAASHDCKQSAFADNTATDKAQHLRCARSSHLQGAQCHTISTLRMARLRLCVSTERSLRRRTGGTIKPNTATTRSFPNGA